MSSHTIECVQPGLYYMITFTQNQVGNPLIDRDNLVSNIKKKKKKEMQDILSCLQFTEPCQEKSRDFPVNTEDRFALS